MAASAASNSYFILSSRSAIFRASYPKRFRLNHLRTSAFAIIATTPKARTRTHTAARKPLYHQRVANGTVRNCLGRIDLSCGFLRLASFASRTNDANQTALSFQPDCEWSDWGERHGRLRREVAVERSGSCRDTIGQFAGQPWLNAPNLPRLSKSFSLSRFLIFNSAFLLARSAPFFSANGRIRRGESPR